MKTLLPFRVSLAATLLMATLSLPLLAQQPTKILTQPLTVRVGEPLSNRTLVQRLQSIPGVLSWTIETRRHRGQLLCMTLSPDGKEIATGGLDGTIRIWDAETGVFLRALVGHTSYIFGLAWSPDGKTLASTGSFDGTARLWDSSTGLLLRTLKGHKQFTKHVSWSRDGKSLLVTGGASGFMTLWDINKPDPIATSEIGCLITGISWGTTDRVVAVSGVTSGVQVWDVLAGKVLHSLKVPGITAASVAWSPDGKSIVGGAAGKTIIWDAETGKELKTLETDGVAVAFNKSGSHLAVSSGLIVNIWETTFKDNPKALPLADARLMNWTPDGERLVIQSETHVKSRLIAGTQSPLDIEVARNFPVQYTPGRPLVSFAHPNAPELFDVTTGKSIAKLEGHTQRILTVAWSKTGKYLATASVDKTVKVWDSTGKLEQTLKGHDSAVVSVAWADDQRLASGSADKSVRVWDIQNEKCLSIFKDHKGMVNTLCWSKDGKQLASGDEDFMVWISSPDSEKPAQSCQASGPARSLAWSPNGRNLAVGNTQGNVDVFNVTNGKLIQSFESEGIKSTDTPVPGKVRTNFTHQFPASSMVWANDSSTLMVGRTNHIAQTWRLGEKKPLSLFESMSAVNQLLMPPGTGTIILSEDGRIARVMELSTKKLRTTLVVDHDQLAAISTNGNYRVPDEATSELIFVVQTTKGQETYSLSEFTTKFKFKNQPSAISLGDK